MVRIQALVNGLDRLFPLILRAFDARRRIYLHSDRGCQRGDAIFSRASGMQNPHTAVRANAARQFSVPGGTRALRKDATQAFSMAALLFYRAQPLVRGTFSNDLHPRRSGE